MIWNGYLNFLPFKVGKLFRATLLISCLFWFSSAKSQISPSDSLFLNNLKGIESFESKSTLDPNRAAFLSAVLPGLGQAYNNQYWKIPLIYGGGIALAHYLNYNHKLYWEFDRALRRELDDSLENPYSDRFKKNSLTRNREVFRRNRDFLMIITAAYYLLNVVDAHVSAHLHEFEINENLSLNINPTIQSTPLFSRTLGISFTLNFN